MSSPTGSTTHVQCQRGRSGEVLWKSSANNQTAGRYIYENHEATVQNKFGWFREDGHKLPIQEWSRFVDDNTGWKSCETLVSSETAGTAILAFRPSTLRIRGKPGDVGKGRRKAVAAYCRGREKNCSS